MGRLSLGVRSKRRRLNIAAMPNCEWWVDLARSDTITFASGVNVSQVRDLSGKNRHLTKTGAGNETTYPTYVAAERGLSFLSASLDQMIAGAQGDWNFLHNGTGCTILALVKVDSAQASNAVIFSTTSESVPGIGTALWYQNTNQNYQIITRNGSSQVYVNAGATNSLTKNTNVIVSIHIQNKTGNPPDLVTRYNGATDIRTGPFAAYSTSNSTGALFIGKLPDANFKCRMLFKKCAIFSRRISKAEENAILEAWAAEDNISLTRYGTRDLAVIAGQSNAKGRGLISDTSFAGAPTVTGARIFNSTGFSWATLVAGTNNDAYTASHLGLEMNLAKQFIALSGRNLDIVKSGVDGTYLYQWDTANSNFTNLQTAMQRAYWELEDAGYVVKPFFIWYQGESDAQNTTDADLYLSRLQTFLPAILNIPGFQQAPTWLVQIQQNPALVGTNTVVTAQMTTAMTTPFSAYTHFVEIGDIAMNFDAHHINAASLNAVASRIAHRQLGIPE